MKWLHRTSISFANHSQRIVLGLSACACTFNSPLAASAERPTMLLEEITVTARRREERLNEVPIAASVLDASSLLGKGLPSDTRALLSEIPGLRFNDTTSPTTSELTMRGSGTGRGTSADSGVGLYRNGVYVGGGLQYGRNFLRLDMFDLERAEVLRGTLGALYGRNAVGGAINLISARPEFEPSGRADVEYGWDVEGVQAQGVLNQPLSDSFAMRLGVDYVDQSEGFYYNKSFNEYFDAQSGYGARAQLRFRSGDLDVNLLVEQQEHSVSAVVASLDIPPTLPNFPLGYADEQYAYFWSVPGKADLDLQGTILSITYDFDSAVLSSTTSYRDRTGVTVSDVDNFSPESRAAEQARGNPMTTIDPGQTLTADDTTRAFYQELHLAGETGALAWLLGAEYIGLDSDFLIRFARTPGFLGVPLPGVDTYQTLEYESLATYGSLEYAATDRLKLTGEIRYTEDEKDFTTRQQILGTTVVIAPTTQINPTFQNTAYNAIAAFDFTPDLMAYAKAGTGYRVGGFNTVVTVPNQPKPVPESYDNEDSITYEVGLKSTGASYSATAAAYLSRVDGALITDTNGCSLANACGQNPTSFTTNGGDASIWGVELEASKLVSVGAGQLRMKAAVSRQEGEFTSGIFDAFDIPQTPEWTASADVHWTAPLGAQNELMLGVSYYGQWGGVQDVTVPLFDLADRQITDVRIGFTRGRWQTILAVRNVFDEEYYVLRQPTLYRWNNDRRSSSLQVRYAW